MSSKFESLMNAILFSTLIETLPVLLNSKSEKLTNEAVNLNGACLNIRLSQMKSNYI